VYLDDIVLYTDTIEELHEAIGRTLKRVQEFGLKCKTRKCNIVDVDLHYLGYNVHSGTLSAETAKLDKLRAWPEPTNKREVQSFVGFANFYRPLVRDFSAIAAPLHKGAATRPFVFGPAEVAAFGALKEALLSAPPLRVPDTAAPFVLETDASATAAGAGLYQTEKSGGLVPVGWFSHRFTPNEERYTVYEREFYAFVLACNHFRRYLEGNKFTFRTDNAGIKGMFNHRLGDNKRVDRWIMRLQGLQFAIEKIPGSKNQVADGLSRAPLSFHTGEGEPEYPGETLLSVPVVRNDGDEPGESPGATGGGQSVFPILEDAGQGPNPELPPLNLAPLTAGEVREAQHADPDIVAVLPLVATGMLYPEDDLRDVGQTLDPLGKYLLERFGNLEIPEGILVVGGEGLQRVVLPD
jgi:hypothetical protein